MTLKDDLQVEPKSDWLLGLDMALAVSAGVAASETVKLVRELRRHRAEVTVYLTPNADRFVGKTALEWASARQLITSFTSDAAHVFSHQLLLVAPATLNCVSSLAAGLADNVVTTLAQSLLGMMHLERSQSSGSKATANEQAASYNGNRKNSGLTAPSRFLLAPSMHASMQANPIYRQALVKLESFGVVSIPSEFDEGKAKMACTETVIDYTARAYNTIRYYDSVVGSKSTPAKKNKQGNEQEVFSLEQKRVLITAGSTSERIDSVRVISNKSSGKTGLKLARRAFHFGADVHLLANSELADKVPPYMTTKFFTDSLQYKQGCFSILDSQRFDIAVMVAAVSDFSTQSFVGKIASKAAFSLELKPLEKVIDAIVSRYRELKVVGFKLYAGNGKQSLSPDEAVALEKLKDTTTDEEAKRAAVKRAMEMLANGVYAVVVNSVEAMNYESSDGPVRWLYQLRQKEVVLHSDEQLACMLWRLA